MAFLKDSSSFTFGRIIIEKPEEVASAIAWLVSSESSYTTGSFIEVSGGR
jgi:NAD(P)-dependent dehydrogenase (short-subunit alcohol dehydrogenase family)